MISERGEKNFCLECGGDKVTEKIREQEFTYGTPGNEVTLAARMPVITCQDCHYEFFDERGEAARHAAVCKHLRVYSPEEVREIRRTTGLNRTEFCEVTGFGIASLQRWETGEVIPNSSSDRLIFLLRYPENLTRLRDRHAEEPVSISVADGAATKLDPVAVSAVASLAPEVHTRRGKKRFVRLSQRPRIADQAASWSLRAR